MQITAVSEQVTYEEKQQASVQLAEKQAALEADKQQLQEVAEKEAELKAAAGQLAEQAHAMEQQMEQLRQQVRGAAWCCGLSFASSRLQCCRQFCSSHVLHSFYA